MKLNISCPSTGLQKAVEIEDDSKLRALYDKRISHEVNGEDLNEDWEGYIFKITGGNDLQGFPMKQGLMTPNRVRLLLRAGVSCYRPRRKGERKRKSVRGCIVSQEMSAVHLVIVKLGAKDIEGLTDSVKPRRLGPKRASKIRKLFNLSKEDDVCKYVIRRKIEKGDKSYTKAPKIQRLVTPIRLQRRRRYRAELRSRIEKSKESAKEYNTLIAQRQKEAKAIRQKRKESRKSSHMSS